MRLSEKYTSSLDLKGVSSVGYLFDIGYGEKNIFYKGFH